MAHGAKALWEFPQQRKCDIDTITNNTDDLLTDNAEMASDFKFYIL